MKTLAALILLASVAASSGYGVRWYGEPRPPAEGLELADVFLTDGECGRTGRVITLKSERKDGPTYYVHEQGTPRSQRLNVKGNFCGEKILIVIELDH